MERHEFDWADSLVKRKFVDNPQGEAGSCISLVEGLFDWGQSGFKVG